LVIGAVALALALVLLVVAAFQYRAIAAAARTPTTPCGQATAGARELAGVAAPVPGVATLRSPFTGQDCLWYWARVQLLVPVDTGFRKETLYEVVSREPFAVRDDTGQVTIEPPATRDDRFLELAPQQLDETFQGTEQPRVFGIELPDKRFSSRIYQERILEEGETLYVLGDVAEDGVVRKASLVSVLSEEDVLRDRRTQLKISLWAAAACLLVGVWALVF
jgi:hypothetical protein